MAFGPPVRAAAAAVAVVAATSAAAALPGCSPSPPRSAAEPPAQQSPPAPPSQPPAAARPAAAAAPPAAPAPQLKGPLADLWRALQRGRPSHGLVEAAAKLPRGEAAALRDALGSGLPGHRLAAVELAAWVPVSLRNACLDALFELLAHDADLEVRAAVAGHFARQPTERAEDVLVAALQRDASPRVRAAAAEALGRLQEPEGGRAPTPAGQALRRALQEDDVAVASAAVVALRRRGDFGAVEALRRARKDAKHPAVRLNASEALSVLTGRRDGLAPSGPDDNARDAEDAEDADGAPR
jgi:hypothetical protein